MKIRYTQKGAAYKVKHFFLYTISDKGFFMANGHYKDMVRYDGCFINKSDLAKIQDTKDEFSIRVLFVQTSITTSEPTVGRWNSFGIRIGNKQELSSYEVESDMDQWVHLKHSEDYSGYDEVTLRSMVASY